MVGSCEIQEEAGPRSLPAWAGKPARLFWSLVAPAVPLAVVAALRSVPLTSRASTLRRTVAFLSVASLLTKTLAIGLRAHLDSPGQSHFQILHYICKDLFLKYSHVPGGHLFFGSTSQPNANGFHTPLVVAILPNTLGIFVKNGYSYRRSV